jgi:hypothetical protein
VLSRLFRRRFLEELGKAHRAGQLRFFGDEAGLADPAAFAAWMKPLRQCEWVVYAKRPFAGPAAVLAYLSRYTHRVAISNQRLVALDERGVTFRWKDYRATGRTRHKTMTLGADEFMRRFLLHVLPGGFHRIRHYGLLANAGGGRIWPGRGNCWGWHRSRRRPRSPRRRPATSSPPCVPVLRGGDGRRRDPRTQTVDPRSTATIGLPMNTHVPCCANRLSAPGLPEPQGDACAGHGDRAVSVRSAGIAQAFLPHVG